MTRQGEPNGYDPDRDFAQDNTQYLGPTAGGQNTSGAGADETRYQPAQPTQYGEPVPSQSPQENAPRQYFPGEASPAGYQPQAEPTYYEQSAAPAPAPVPAKSGGGGNGLLTAVAVLALIAAVVFFILWLTSSGEAGVGEDETVTPITETVTETTEAEPTTITSTETFTPEPETIEVPSGEDIQNQLDSLLDSFNDPAPAPEPAPAQ